MVKDIQRTLVDGGGMPYCASRKKLENPAPIAYNRDNTRRG